MVGWWLCPWAKEVEVGEQKVKQGGGERVLRGEAVLEGQAAPTG